MTHVWIASAWDDGAPFVIGAYSTKELAEAATKGYGFVECHEVDPAPPSTPADVEEVTLEIRGKSGPTVSIQGVRVSLGDGVREYRFDVPPDAPPGPLLVIHRDGDEVRTVARGVPHIAYPHPPARQNAE